jgi:autotransporter-associated beta strand protein
VNVNATTSTTLSGTIANSYGLLALAKNGTGTLVISNPGNSYAGGTTLNTGTLIVNGNSYDGSGTPLGTGTLTIKGGTLGTTLLPSSGATTLNNPISLLGNFSLATNSNSSNPGAQNFVLNGNIDLNGVTRTITGTTNMGQPQFGGSIGVPGETAGLNFNTPFTAAGSYVAFIFNPSNVNNYTGLTTVNNGAILAFEGATANGAIRGNLTITGNGVVDYIMGSGSAEQIADTSTVTVNSSGNTASGIHFDGMELRGANETIGALNGSGKVGLGSGTLTVGAGTFTGIIEDGAFAVGTGGSLIKNTAGTLILSGKNTYTGFTAVAAGTLQAGAVNVIPSGSPLYVDAGGTFKLNNFAQSVASLNGSGSISLGSGTLTVGSANTNTGFSGAISGTGGLTKIGAGMLALNGTNTYTGLTTLTHGMLLIAPTSTVPVLSSSSRLVVGGTTTNDGGTFVLYGVANNSTSQILNGLTVNAGSSLIAVDNLGTTTTLDLRGPLGTLGITRNANGFVDFQAVNGTLGVDTFIKVHQANDASGILGGWATVNGGTGFAANNGSDVIVAYTGYTDIAATSDTVPNNANRNVRINSAGIGGSDVIAAHPLTSINTLTQNSTTASTIALAGGTLKLGTNGGILITPDNAGLTIGAAPGDGVLAAVGTANVTLANYSTNGPLTINSAITNAGGGAVSVRFTGNGTTVFAGANAYTGGTAILSGLLRTDAVNTIPSASAVILNNIATLDLNNNSQTVASINDGPNGGGNIALGTATLTLGSTNANSVVTGAISGTNGSLVKNGTGSLTLSGANTYTGGTTLNSGTLIANGSLGSGTLTIKGGTLGTTLPTGNTLYNPISLLGNFSLATNSNPSSPGTQNFVLNGNIDLGGATRTITGTTNMGQPQFGGSIGVPGETAGLNFNTSFTAAGSYVAFVFNPSNVNNYTGLTTVNNGAILVFAGATANGAIRGNLNITGNGVVDYIMGNTAPEQIADTSTVTVNSSGNTASGLHFDGLELRGANETIGTLNGSGKVGLGSGMLTVGSGNFTGIIEDGAFAVGTGGSLIKNTAGTLILSGRNTYTGYTAVTAGTLQAGAANTIPAISMVGIGAGATLDLHNFSQSVGSIVNVNGTGGTIKLGTAVLTTGSDGQNAIFSGVIQDSGRLVKVGTGGLNLTGANTYTGGTTINAGVLLANNTTGSATGSGAVTVNSGATLGGGGTILGAVTLNNGGVVNPGVATPGTAGTTLHATSMMWNGGGTLKLQLGAPGDELVLTGALTKGTAGVYAINIADAGITQTSYTLATFASTTFAATNFTLTLPAGDTGNLILTSTSLVLNITSVAPASPGQQPASYDSGGVLIAGQPSGGDPTQTIDSGELQFGGGGYSGVTVTAAANYTDPTNPTIHLNFGTLPGVTIQSNFTPTPTPEPSGVALLCVGTVSLLGRRRRRQR